jgi:hypothetical protein
MSVSNIVWTHKFLKRTINACFCTALTRTHTCTPTLTRTHTCTPTLPHSLTHTHTLTNARALAHAHAHTHIHTYTHTRTHTHKCTRTCTCKRTYTHTHVHTHVQVKALLSAMDILNQRVGKLDSRMGGMQAQILRLEASSNETSHGLLGKTLDEQQVFPLQQMRPKSASRRCVWVWVWVCVCVCVCVCV